MQPWRSTGSQKPGPAARTAARQQDAAYMALPAACALLLQHSPNIRAQLPLVCKLLCCSKWLAAEVAEHCAGQLDMHAPTFAGDEAAPWLRKHARLLRSLDLQAPGRNSSAACVAAIMAAGPQSLLLQSLVIQASSITLPLLEQLPASSLTRLIANAEGVGVQPADRPALVARVSAALGRLTALRSLELCRSSLGEAPGLCGLATLSQLTALCFQGPLSDLQHSPPQLLELEINTHYAGEQPLLDLRHLSGVTALDIPYVPVEAGHTLPPNLRRLHAVYCRSALPLLPLVQLQQLHLGLGGSDITADHLRQLSSLTSLSLGYDGSTEPASSGAWPLLPLQRLALVCSTLSEPVCQQLAQLSGLTSLALQQFQLPQAASAQELATALRRLSGLQQLELSERGYGPHWAPFDSGFYGLPPTTVDAATAAGRQQLLQAIGSLQQLRELCLRAFSAFSANSSSLAALTALTGLTLFDCDLTDAAVTAIVLQLPGLLNLDCSGNRRMADASLPAVGRLQQLTRLSLVRTGVRNVGLSQLAGLTRLRELDLRGTHVTYAGIRRLAGLAGLRDLSMPVACETEQQIKQRNWLRQRLPDLRVTY